MADVITQPNDTLFSLKQRELDGKWEVIVQKTDQELGITTYRNEETGEDEPLSPYHLTNLRWVVVAVYEKKPKTDEVLRLLGLRRKK